MLQVEDNVRTHDSELFGVILARTVLVAPGYLVRFEDDDGHKETVLLADNALVLQCPFCPNQDVDSDWRACPKCREII